MLTFDQTFLPTAITKELCKARLRLAEQRHDALFFHFIDKSRDSAEDIPIPATWREVPVKIFPSRKLWKSFRSRDRSRQSDPNLSSLTRAIEKLSAENPEADWYLALKEVIDLISTRALSGAVTFSTPVIINELKDKEKQTYRPLSSFFLVDKIIESLTARYLREALNDVLLPSCLAFRPQTDGRHDGLNRILEKIVAQGDHGLYVAECDIMGFYDCVSHQVARESLYLLIDEACERDPTLKIDSRALQIFEAYLDCYAFKRTVKELAEPKLKKANPAANYPWREEQLRILHGQACALDDIGIPQGGAISGLIANAVLHRADKALQPFCDMRDVTYLRYCDDIIILAPTQSACQAAFLEYRNTVRELKLPIHEPKKPPPYVGHNRKAFWTESKSKNVYHWGDPEAGLSFPWVQFLGYQIRHDRLIRVRRSSINKEMKKLARETDRILQMLTPENVDNLRKSKKSIRHRTRMRLISMAVGRRGLREPQEPMPKCWCNGFRWLASKNILPGNLKALDRQRERQINRVARRLRRINLDVPPTANEDQNILGHYGCPFSYWGQFRRKS